MRGGGCWGMKESVEGMDVCEKMTEGLELLCLVVLVCKAFEMGQSLGDVIVNMYACMHTCAPFLLYAVAASRVQRAPVSGWWLEGSMSPAL